MTLACFAGKFLGATSWMLSGSGWIKGERGNHENQGLGLFVDQLTKGHLKGIALLKKQGKGAFSSWINGMQSKMC